MLPDFFVKHAVEEENEQPLDHFRERKNKSKCFNTTKLQIQIGIRAKLF